MSQVISVAVIGTGAAGICAIKQFVCADLSDCDNSTQFLVKAFEQTAQIGGTWAYADHVGQDEKGVPVHSSMYKNLRTNLPKHCMQFPDYPMPEHLPSFLTHKEMHTYLEDYVSHFDLRKHIQFKTIVKHVRPVQNENNGKFPVSWEVTTADVTDRNNQQTEKFDAVLVCNGQFSVPKMVETPGLGTFDGHLIHSHNYREPKAYVGKTVVVVGAGFSGQDIGIEVASVATKVYLCYHTEPIKSILPSNVELKPNIQHCDGRVVEFEDGTTIRDIDAIILCTGYKHDYAFLDDSIGLNVEEYRVTPLFKQFTPIGYPTLGIAGVPRISCFFPMFYIQARYFRAILNGTVNLPSEEEMKKDEEEDYRDQLRRGKKAHHMFEKQIDYFDSLSDMGRLERLPRIVHKCFLQVMAMIQEDVTTFRDYHYVVENADTPKVIKFE